MCAKESVEMGKSVQVLRNVVGIQPRISAAISISFVVKRGAALDYANVVPLRIIVSFNNQFD